MSIEPRRSFNKRMNDGFKSAKKGWGLPKVNRARGKSVPRKGTRALSKVGRKNKNKNKRKEPKREPTPALPKELENILQGENKEFILWLGQGFVDSLYKTDADQDILDVLAEISELLSDEQKEGLKDQMTKGTIADAKATIAGHLGADKFSSLFKFALENKVAGFAPSSSSFQHLKALKPSLIVYTGNDCYAEQKFRHNNFGVEKHYPSTLEAESSLGKLEGEAKIAAALQSLLGGKTQSLLKICGDVENPETLQSLSTALDNDFCAELLSSLFAQHPVVFLGQDLTENDPVSKILAAVSKTEGEKTKLTNVGLVTKTTEANKRPAVADVNTMYVEYIPDVAATQVTEFLANMASCRSGPGAIPTPPGGISHRAFVEVHEAFTQELTNKEQSAREVSFYVSDFNDLLFVNDETFNEKVLSPILKSVMTPEEATALVAALTERAAFFHDALVPPAPVVEEATDEKKDGEKEDEEKPKPTPVKDDTPKFFVRVLIPAEGMTFDKKMVSKCESFKRMMENSENVEFRITNVAKDFISSFEIIFTEGKDSVGDVHLSMKTRETGAGYATDWLQQNTNEAEEKFLLFERLWSSASDPKQSLTLLSNAIGEAKTRKAKKPKKAKPVKAPKEEKKAGKAKQASKETNKSKTGKTNFMRRIGRTMTRSNRHTAKATPIEGKAVEEPKEEVKVVEVEKKAEVEKVEPKGAVVEEKKTEVVVEDKKDVKEEEKKKEDDKEEKLSPKEEKARLKAEKKRKAQEKKEAKRKLKEEKKSQKEAALKKDEEKTEEKKEEPEAVEEKKEEAKVEEKKEEVKAEEKKEEVKEVVKEEDTGEKEEEKLSPTEEKARLKAEKKRKAQEKKEAKRKLKEDKKAKKEEEKKAEEPKVEEKEEEKKDEEKKEEEKKEEVKE